MVLSIHTENASTMTKRYLGMFLGGQVDRQAGRQKGGQTDVAKTIPPPPPPDFIGGN